jgi:hypothetical protein
MVYLTWGKDMLAADRMRKSVTTDEVAYATIKAQKLARDEKTARLRELRLAREAELAAIAAGS